MSKGRLEALITVPTGGWTGTIDDSGGGAAVAWTLAAGTYYLTTLLAAFQDALNLAAPTDTLTVSCSKGEGGTGKVSITSSGNASLVWTSTDLRDLLGYTGTLTLTAAVANTATKQARSLWIADCPYDAPNEIGDWTGWMETDARSSESLAGDVYSISGQYKEATWLRWGAVARTRASLANESTENESFQRFVMDGVWGFAAWGTPGGTVRFYPSADAGAWVEYAVNLSQFEDFKPDHFVEGWAGGPWKCGFERLVAQDSSDRLDIGVTSLTSGSSTTDGSSIATSSISPGGSRAIYAYVASNEGTSPNQPTATGCGLTWVVEKSLLFNSNVRRVTVFRAMGASPTPGAVTFDFGGQTQTSFAWAIVECSNVDTSGTSASGATVQSTSLAAAAATTTTGTLAALENPNNVHLAAVALNLNGSVTPDGDFAELSDNAIASGVLTLEVEYAVGQTVCTPTFSGSAASGIIDVEVKAG